MAPRASAHRKIQVTHVVLSLNVGGLEHMLVRLLRHTDRDHFEPRVCALDEPGTLADEVARLDVPLTVIPRGKVGIDGQLPFRLGSDFLRHETRIVHTHNPSPHLYGAAGAWVARAKQRGAPPRVVHTKHGRNDPDARRKVLVNRIASAMTDRIVAVSDDARMVAIEIERVSPRKVITIRNGVDTTEFHLPADPRKARARMGLPPQGFVVGCVARLSPIKDHGTLLEAYALLRRTQPDAHLVLVGDGPERARLEVHARQLGLDRSAITFAGEQRDVASWLEALDVFALSSLSEGISLTLLEAAATGLPIVATRVGGNEEIVSDRVTGVLVPPADPRAFAHALDILARSSERRIRMGLSGRARVEVRFSAERMARAYGELYEKLL